MSSSELCQLLPWDSQYFGFNIARITSTRPSAPELERAVYWCLEHHVRCAYFLCDSAALDAAEAASRTGFRIVDVRISLLRSVDAGPLEDASSLRSRLATERDLPELKRIARQNIRETRFSRDTQFSQERVDSLYQLWIERDLASSDRMVMTVEVENTVVGFASARFESDGNSEVSLVAVDSEFRGRGVATAALRALIAALSERRVKFVRVHTQATNTSALRLYENNRFVTESVHFWFHRWFSGHDSI